MDNYSYSMNYNSFDFSDRLVYSPEESQITTSTTTIHRLPTNQYMTQYSPPAPVPAPAPPLPIVPYASPPPLGNQTNGIPTNHYHHQPTRNLDLKRKRSLHDELLPLLSPSSTSSFSTTATTSAPEPTNKVSKTSPKATPINKRAGSSSHAADNEKPSAENDDEVDEEKLRMKNLERNRLAAYKCRQRKKEWIDELAHKADRMARENERLRQLLLQLKEEALYLKTQLILHNENKQQKQQQQQSDVNYHADQNI